MGDLDKIRALLDATAGHTPGPWSGDRLDGTIKYAARSADGRIVLTADHTNGRYGFVAGDSLGDDEIGGEHEADERLFLRGPDLRTALAEAAEEITTLRTALAGWPIAMADAIRACMEMARKEREP